MMNGRSTVPMASKIHKTWYFNNGRLKKIQLDQNGENKILDVYQKDFKAYKTII